MSDYSQYQGPSKQWDEYVQKNPQPSTTLSASPQAIRRTTNALRTRISEAELAAEDLYSKATWRDYSISVSDNQDITARIYRPRELPIETVLPIYLYFHGGGHLFGTIETEDAACARIASSAKITVVNINYRHTPEFKHPAQVNDAWDSFKWLANNASAIGGDPHRVIVGGISAGAGLAAYIVVRHNDLLSNADSSTLDLKICGQLLCIPWLVHMDNHRFASAPTSSFQQNVNAAVLPLPLLRLFTDLLDVKDYKDPSLNVALIEDTNASGLPKTSLLIAGQDLLRDEGLCYAKKLDTAGVPTKVHIFPGLPHGFRRYSSLPASKRWDELLVEGFEWFLSTDTDSSFTEENTS